MNTLQKSIICISLLGFSVISCNKETKAEGTPNELAPGEVPPTQNPAFVNLNNPAAATATPAGAASTAAPATNTTATAPGMNPPHGQPGHRCEIPVGAPLDSQPTKKAPQTQSQPAAAPAASFAPPAARQQPATAAPVTTAPGMNPPHGQPGHRCDVAVGAPLP